MNHSDVQDQLEFYIKRELEPDAFNEITDHLDNCQECMGEHDSLQSYFVALENLETESAPANFLGSVYKKINTKTKTEKLVGAISSVLGPPKIWGLTGAIAGLLILSTLLIRTKDFDPAYETISKEPLTITSHDEKQSEMEIKRNDTIEKGIIIEDPIVIVEGSPAEAEPEAPADEMALAEADAETRHSSGGSRAGLKQSPSASPARGGGAGSKPAEVSPKMEKGERPVAPVAMAKKKRMPLEKTARAPVKYQVKSKNVAGWTDSPDAVYVLDGSGLSVVTLNTTDPELKAAAESSFSEKDETSQYLLKDGDRLIILLELSIKSTPDPGAAIKGFLAKSNSQNIQESRAPGGKTITGKIPRGSFPGFIGDLKSLGSPSSKPFSLSADKYIPVKISIKSH